MAPSQFRFLQVFALLLMAAACALPQPVSARSLIEAGEASEWKFLTGTNVPSASWRKAGFDDRHWRSGRTPIGYGEPRLTTKLFFSSDTASQPMTTWFRRNLAPTPLRPGEGLVILLCVDDGAVLYLNGREIARQNMPNGTVSATTPARQAITDRNEGHYTRIPVPMRAWRARGTNVLAIEIHQASPADDDCFFDLALKTLPATEPRPKVSPAAQAAMNDYYQQHYVGPGTKLPDGYLDGGRYMKLDTEGRARSGREILIVDRARDDGLAKHLDFARSTNLLALSPLERTQRLAEYIDRLTTPPGGRRWVGPAVDDLTKEFANKPLRIGDVLDQGQAGVCRHRSLLFKLLADEAGLKSALVRGNYATGGPRTGAHAWNEIQLDDGRRLLVDVMHNGGKPRFPAVTNSFVVQHYLKPDDTPWYGTNASGTAKPAH